MSISIVIQIQIIYILLIVYINNYCDCFLKITNIYKYKFKNFKMSMLNTCYPDDNDDDETYINKINSILYNKIELENEKYINKPLYTLIWYDCEKCMNLLKEMDYLNLKKIYINGGYYFYDIADVNSEFNNPLLYKDDEFIGDNLYDIYSEIYKEC